MRLRRPLQPSARDAENDALREALRASHAAYRSLLDSVPEAFVQLDQHGRIIDWNVAAEQTFGWPRYEAIGRTLLETIIPEREHEATQAMFRKFFETGEGDTVGKRVERTAVRKDGREIVVSLTVGAEQQPQGWIFNAFAHDIGDRQRHERYLEAQRRLALVLAEGRSPERTWRRLLETIGESLGWGAGAVWLLDEHAQQLECPELWHAPEIDGAELYAVSRSLRLERGVGLPGRVWESGETVWIEGDVDGDATLPRRAVVRRAGLRAALALPLRVGGEFVGAMEFFSRESIAWDDDVVELMRLGSEQVSQFLQRARAESELARTAEQLAEAQAIAEVGSWEWHVTTGEIVWSDETYRIYSHTRDTFNPSNASLLAAVHPADRDRVQMLVDQTFRTQEPFDFVHRVQDGDHEPRVVRARGRIVLGATGEPERMLGTVQDVTAALAAEEKLRETQKLESLGVLAGGVAHDFNNLLVGILGNASLARESVVAGSELDRQLEQIELAGGRAAELAEQMLAYSGRGRVVPVSRDLRQAVAEIAQLLSAAIPENVSLELDFADDVPPVLADSGQLTQVLMNLLTNAAEAVGAERGAVRVRVELREVGAGALSAFSHADGIAPGPYVAIEVADNGAGMEPETVSRIFEPFFTTKFSGRGLGLAAVLGIVRGHGGAVRVASTPGAGTTFTILWPPAREVVAAGD
jgi:PAS domain S-box-containing protein